MGYSTDFVGGFGLDRPLTKAHADYLTAFSRTRRMKRQPEVAETLSDPIRIAAGLPIGPEGAYYVGEDDNNFGQTKDSSIIDYNGPPAGQPGLWCQWEPGNEDSAIVWDGGEKFDNYVEWIEYLIENFLQPWGYVVNGEVEWAGEDVDDRGKIVVTDNSVQVLVGHIGYSCEQDLITKHGVWGEHPDYPVADWQYEVANNDTREGYWHWVSNKIMNEE